MQDDTRAPPKITPGSPLDRWNRCNGRGLQNLTAAQWIVFARVAWRMGKPGQHFEESAEAMANELPLNEKTIRRAFQVLVDLGLLDVVLKRKGRAPSIYLIKPDRMSGLSPAKGSDKPDIYDPQTGHSVPANRSECPANREVTEKEHSAPRKAEPAPRSRPLSAHDAWQEFQAIFRNHSHRQSIPWPDDDGRTRAAVKACGGFGTFRNSQERELTGLRHRFLDAYRAVTPPDASQ